jgi:dienelactone hydrolase
MDAMSDIASPNSSFLIKISPDFQASTSILPFLIRCRTSVSQRIIFDFFKALRTSPDIFGLKIGVAGFCWVGKYNILLAHNNPECRVPGSGAEMGKSRSLVDEAFLANPSGVSALGDFEKVTVPLSTAVGDADMMTNIKQVQQSKAILEKKDICHEVVVYQGVMHGFAVRGDPKDPKQKDMGEKALLQVIGWFGKRLA